MPLICDWCNQSIHRSEKTINEEEVDPTGEFLSRYGGKTGWNYNFETFGFFDPEIVYFTLADYENWGGQGGGYSKSLYEIADGWEEESGAYFQGPTGCICETCLESIAAECIQSSQSASRPFENGGWMGFTSKYFFSGGKSQPPIIIAVCAAELKCVDCEKNQSSLQIVYVPGNNNKQWDKEVQDYDDNWVTSGEYWTTDDLQIIRGPEVDSIRRGIWDPLVFESYIQNEEDEYERTITVECEFQKGSLTTKGWVCEDCDVPA